MGIKLVVFFSVFLLSAYFSLRANLRRDWAKHMPKGRALKVPVLGMISAACIPRRIKPRGWLIWDQRQWFRDMKVCQGLVAAYQDTRCWKRSEMRGNHE